MSGQPTSAGARFLPPEPRPPAKEDNYKKNKFFQILSADTVDLESLREAAWNGLPKDVRPIAWQLLLGYLPINRHHRETVIKRKREEYLGSIPRYFDVPDSSRSTQEISMLRQILVDIPRTTSNIPLYQQPAIQRSLERLLFIWAVRHPASGYVQGINDLTIPLFLTFLSSFVDDPENCTEEDIDPEMLKCVEADCYWCLTKILDGIQDHYTVGQPGVQRMVRLLEDLIQRVDVKLYEHLHEQGLQFIQFSFRWMNCLLMRELNLVCITRLWDSYLAEQRGGFDTFHVFVSAAFLLTWSKKLQEMQFQDLLLFMQTPPTANWGINEMEVLLSQAFILKSLYGEAPNHLNPS